MHYSPFDIVIERFDERFLNSVSMLLMEVPLNKANKMTNIFRFTKENAGLSRMLYRFPPYGFALEAFNNSFNCAAVTLLFPDGTILLLEFLSYYLRTHHLPEGIALLIVLYNDSFDGRATKKALPFE